MRKNINFNDINIPDDYFTMDEIEKLVIVQDLVDAVIEVVDNSLINPQLRSQDVAKRLLQRTLKEHEQNESYEICALIKDMINLLDEQ